MPYRLSSRALVLSQFYAEPVDAFFMPDGDGRYVATELTRGPWDAHAQHAGPPAALLGRAMERCEPRPDSMMTRLVFDILRPVPIAPLEVRAAVLRPGRKVMLVGATLTAGGQEVMRATGWRMRTEPVAVDVTPPVDPPPGPLDAEPFEGFPDAHGVGYDTAMEWRFVAGGFTQLGPGTAWLRMRYPLVAGEDPSPLTRVLVAADSGNGVSGAVDFRRFLAVNTDLSVYLHRLPVGEWVCLDAVMTVEDNGVGLAASTVSDERSVIGRGLQTLFIAPR